jgi:hypothetical protein
MSKQRVAFRRSPDDVMPASRWIEVPGERVPRICANERTRDRRNGRYYDPATGQLLSVDPLVDETGQPYAYTGDDPVNESDPSGLSGDVSADEAYDVQHSCEGQYASAPGCGQHWYQSSSLAVTGVVLGGVAAATGVGALIEGATALGFALASTAVVTGVGAGIIDYDPCKQGQQIACLGLGLGLLGAGVGLGPLAGTGLTIAGVIGEDSLANAILSDLLGGLGLNAGLAGLTIDLFQIIFENPSGASRPSSLCETK